ncbi:hypothetical protein RUM43_006039 [Polyplax serrata]|uniref:DNA-directed RNA polymerase n=1 Tax=Polyplax serrata TaxID=468196 RepID=A0AAN8PKH5_POLSC
MTADENEMNTGFREPTLKHLTNLYGVPSKAQNEFLQSLGKPHVDSFDHLIENGLDLITQNLVPIEMTIGQDKLSVYVNDLRLMHPLMKDGSYAVKTHKIYPTECRQRAATYCGHLFGRIQWSINGVMQIPIEKDFGEIPIMVKGHNTTSDVLQNRYKNT